MSIIYAFGDSITYGAWDIEKSGWVARLRQFLDDLQDKNPDYYALLYNLGIPGETTDGLVNRFENELTARKRHNHDSIFIFAFGANDVAYLVEENRFRVSKEKFGENLAQVIEKTQGITKKILLINTLPVVEEKNSVPRNGKTRLNKHIEEYNQVLQELADKYDVKLIDVFSKFAEQDYKKLFVPDDGLHPNSEGHRIMFETIGPEVQKMLGWV